MTTIKVHCLGTKHLSCCRQFPRRRRRRWHYNSITTVRILTRPTIKPLPTIQFRPDTLDNNNSNGLWNMVCRIRVMASCRCHCHHTVEMKVRPPQPRGAVWQCQPVPKAHVVVEKGHKRNSTNPNATPPPPPPQKKHQHDCSTISTSASLTLSFSGWGVAPFVLARTKSARLKLRRQQKEQLQQRQPNKEGPQHQDDDGVPQQSRRKVGLWTAS